MGIDVSVVVPTFRRPKELREALVSALAPSEVRREVLVVDDSPEGSAGEVVASLGDPRVRYLRMAEPTGGRPGAVRNTGLREASGTFVHFLDDDDLVPEGHYEAALAAFAAHPRVGLVFGTVAPFGSAGDEEMANERAFFERASKRAALLTQWGPLAHYALSTEMLFNSTLLVCSAGLARRSAVEAIGGFDPSLRMMEDVEYHSRLIRRHGAHFMDRTSIHYRIHQSLMHGNPDTEAVVSTYKKMHSAYRSERGALGFLATKVFARTALRSF